jgi:aminopeptidase N
LNMLRNVVGDSAFFKGLNLYLTTNKFKNGEAHQLRLALEEVYGRDLNWFFNQWYFGSGHPKVTINYVYDDAAKKVTVIIRQAQGPDNIFKIPLSIDIYTGNNKVRHEVWIKNAEEKFIFNYTTHPDLVNVDAGKSILWEKTDNKTLENFIYQYTHAGNYVDRKEAIIACAKQQDNPLALGLLKTALNDAYYGLRLLAIDQLNFKNETVKIAAEPILAELAKKDKKSTVRAKAIDGLSNYTGNGYKDLFIANLNDSSYSVSGAALKGLTKLDSVAGLAEAKRQMKLKPKGDLEEAITGTLIEFGSEDDFDYITDRYSALPVSQTKFQATVGFAGYLIKVKNPDKVKKGVDLIVAFRNSIPQAYRFQTDGPINGMILSGLATQKDIAGLKDQADYIRSKLPKQ